MSLTVIIYQPREVEAERRQKIEAKAPKNGSKKISTRKTERGLKGK